MKKKGFVVMMLLFGLVMVSCGGNTDSSVSPQPPIVDLNKDITLETFKDCDELLTYTKETLQNTVDEHLDNICVSDVVLNLPVSDSAGPDSTKTNLQENGVDEADLIKSDGDYVYAIVGNEILIVRAWPFESFGKVASI